MKFQVMVWNILVFSEPIFLKAINVNIQVLILARTIWKTLVVIYNHPNVEILRSKVVKGKTNNITKKVGNIKQEDVV